MSEIINTGLLEAGLKSDFFNRLNATPTLFQNVSTRIPSTMPSEKYRWLGTVPNMRQWVDGRQAKGLRSEAYDVTNLKYEATLAVDRDEIDDDQTGQIRIRINELAQRAATHKDFLLGQLLENGGTAGFNSYDGVSFFNDAHVSGASGNQDNNLTSAAADGTQPTTAEMRAALALAVAAMMGFKDDQGSPMSISMGGLICMVPVNYVWVAMEALQAAIISQTSNVMVGAAQVVVNPWLTSQDRFYMIKTDGVIRPFIFQDRAPIEFGSKAEGSEHAFDNEKYLYGVRARYALTYGYWQYCVRHIFT